MGDDRSVLVVDDDLDLRGALELILEGEGYRVLTAANGEEALARLDREIPAVILLDMRMPIMDGWQFAREFRARLGWPCPVVVCTAAEDARRRAMEIEAEGYLEKPFDIDDVLEAIEEALAAPALRPDRPG
jgi:CheY-like chemotaxis protein